MDERAIENPRTYSVSYGAELTPEGVKVYRDLFDYAQEQRRQELIRRYVRKGAD